jgi:hypothetical protein
MVHKRSGDVWEFGLKIVGNWKIEGELGKVER